MKTGIPCAHILTRKTCSDYRDPFHIAVNLFSKQVIPCTLPVQPSMGLQCTAVYAGNIIIKSESLLDLLCLLGNYKTLYCIYIRFFNTFWSNSIESKSSFYYSTICLLLVHSMAAFWKIITALNSHMTFYNFNLNSWQN